jgi:hypothetical protein
MRVCARIAGAGKLDASAAVVLPATNVLRDILRVEFDLVILTLPRNDVCLLYALQIFTDGFAQST